MIKRLSAADILPDLPDILKAQGIPDQPDTRERFQTYIESAQKGFLQICQPVVKTMPVSIQEFEKVYSGLGHNEYPAPLAEIIPQAIDLTLFVATIGAAISVEIEQLFSRRDFLNANILDTVASLGTDRIVHCLETVWDSGEISQSFVLAGAKRLAYSPGYCGWHISGQKALFSLLEPTEIGVRLNASYLMDPLKSVSGVLVTALRETHIFESSFSFCQDCTDQTCQSRIASIDQD